MIDRQQHTREHELSPRSIPLGQFWSSLTSEIGGLFTQHTTSTIPASPLTTTIEMVATKSNGVTKLTTTVETTLVRTSFVTVHLTGGSNTQQTSSSSDSLSPIATHGHHTTLPDSATKHTSKTTIQRSNTLETNQPVNSPSATGSTVASSSSDSHKQAIIGGLSGAIAGLIIIGILICFCLRRRKLRDEESREINQENDPVSEKGLRPAIAQKWSQLTTRKQSIGGAQEVSRSSTPDFDGGLIRMSLDHWPRPFAHGEGYRESMGPALLRVTNPDPSRPETPAARGSSESHGGFLKHQKSAIAAVLLGGNRSRGNSATGSPIPHRNLQVPAISVAPALSRESLAPKAPTPSFRSYTSVSTLPFVEQRPPEDPFLTPPDERDEPPSTPRPRRPSIAPLQSTAGSAGRTLSHIGSALNPFRSKTHVAESLRTQSRYSNSTFSSAGDPFKLDRPSIHEHRTATEFERPPMPTWTVYEGT